MTLNERKMLQLGLVRFACQSGEENTRGRLKLSGKLGHHSAAATVEVAEAEKTALSASLYLQDTQKSHADTCSLEDNRGSRLTRKPSLIPTQTRDRLKLSASFSPTESPPPYCVEKIESWASYQIGKSPLAEKDHLLMNSKANKLNRFTSHSR